MSEVNIDAWALNHATEVGADVGSLVKNMIEADMTMFLADVAQSKAESADDKAEIAMTIKVPFSIAGRKIDYKAVVEWERKKKRKDESERIFLDLDQGKLNLD